MKRIGFLLLAVATLASIVVYMAHASRQSDEDSSRAGPRQSFFQSRYPAGIFNP